MAVIGVVRLNIHVWTLGDYRRKHPKFAALERPTKWETHVYPRSRVENSLLKAATGYEFASTIPISIPEIA